MAHKHLWIGIIANSLLRALIQEAAQWEGKKIWLISFKGSLDTLRSSYEGFRNLANKPRLRRWACNELLAEIGKKRLLLRPFRQEPRVKEAKAQRLSVID